MLKFPKQDYKPIHKFLLFYISEEASTWLA